jgi:hypothetical protein
LLNKQHAMMICNGEYVCILNLDGSDMILSGYGRFLPRETATGTVQWDIRQVYLGSGTPRNFVQRGGGSKN